MTLEPYQVFPLHRNVGRINYDLDDAESLIAADLDGDGLEDIVSLIIEDSTVSVLLQRELDCDRNGVIDSCDFAAGGDADGNGVLDACEPVAFLRGDINADGNVDIGDPIALLSYLFGGGASPGCFAAADTNADAQNDVGDAVTLLSFLFDGASPPPDPFPDCGTSILFDDLQLGCAVPGC
ncbi:MAG: hypothetical protein KDC38_02565 [Planctomycetes bacterium]|nr:hypothetical protein [Planctomycetota bacterium]